MDGHAGRSAKWYTEARKFPQLIGRTPDGARLWGGPYTITQLVVGAVVLLLLWATPSVWARSGLIGNVIVGCGIVYGSIYAAGKLPFGMRNPLVIGRGWLKAIGTIWSGPSPVRLRRPHQSFGGSVLMIIDQDDVDLSEPHSRPPVDELSVKPSPPTTPAPTDPAPALTGVQQLLAGARR